VIENYINAVKEFNGAEYRFLKLVKDFIEK
jgi:hypothetical protein